MKTLTLTNVKKNLGLVTMALVAVLAMTGCGSKKSNNNLNNNFGWNPGCTSCVQGGNLITTALGQSGPQYQPYEQLGLQFYGTGANTQGGTSYYGQVQASGTLIVNAPFPATCGTAPGAYQVSTIQPGTWQGQSFMGLRLQAVGPTTLTIVIDGYVNFSSAKVGQDGQQYASSLNVTSGYIQGGYAQGCSVRFY